MKVGRVRNRFKVGKHFELTIADGGFQWGRREAAIRRESALDGIYVIRTSEPQGHLSPEGTVRTYKRLALVERVFRCLKGIDLRVRPIHHRTATRVRAHFFLCLLAYYVEWHMREALRPLLFDDEQLEQDRQTRDPVAPARSSPSAKRKKAVAGILLRYRETDTTFGVTAHRGWAADPQLRHATPELGDPVPEHLSDAIRPGRAALPATHRAHPPSGARSGAPEGVASAWKCVFVNTSLELAPYCLQPNGTSV